MRPWRSHPVLFLTCIGAVVGFGNALVLEIPALFGKTSYGALSLLQPTFRPAAGTGVLQIAFILLIEVAANVLVYALIFSILGWIFVGVQRLFRRNPH